jgi:hypothetical protein
LGQIIKTEYGKRTIKNTNLFKSIIDHRKKLTPVKAVNYENLTIQKLKILPPLKFYDMYKKDYMEMQSTLLVNTL